MMSLPTLFFFIAEPFNNRHTNVMKRYQTLTTFAHGKCFGNFVILSLGLSVQYYLVNKSEKTSLLEKATDTEPGTFH